MTVIVGLETTVGEKAVVLASDRLQALKEHSWLGCLGLIEKSPDFDLSLYFEFLEKYKRDKSTLNSTRKIQVSPDNQRALVHTGTANKAHEQICELLLDADRFLKNTPLAPPL